MGDPIVQCSYCWEPVEWANLPSHLSEHGGSLEVEAVAVSGKEPTMRTTGSIDERYTQMVRMADSPQTGNETGGSE